MNMKNLLYRSLMRLQNVQYARHASEPFRSLLTGGSRTNLQNSFAYPGFIRFMSLYKQFEDAKIKLNAFSEDPGNEAKLKIYGLFKQATVGNVETKRPGVIDFIGRAKWDAWNAYADMSQDAAKKAYIELVNSLSKQQEVETVPHGTSNQKYKFIIVEVDSGLRKITLNRPDKKNALTFDMYTEIGDALNEAKEDPKTIITTVTGAGSYYCSGNDLGNFMNITPDKIKEAAETGEGHLRKFVGTFIDFDKPLVAVINGPAVGVSVTVLGLFDAVYATDKATFHTPFSALGQSPEGCSSIIFPRLMGYGKSSELLFFNKKITAAEACQLGLVTEVFPDQSFQAEIWPRLLNYAKLPVKSLLFSKQLIRGIDKELLHKVNAMECNRLRERWVSDDCINAVMQFFNRKKQ